MAVVIVLLLLMVVWLLVMVLMATVATATAGTVRQRNARKMGQMWRRRRNLMRGGPWRWRMTHVGMRLLLLRLRGMSVNHPAPAKPTSASSFGSHFYGFGIFRCCTITKSTVGVRRSVFHSCSVN